MKKKKIREKFVQLLYAVFLLFIPVSVFSMDTQADSQKVSVSVEAATTKTFFNELKKQTGLSFIYNSDFERNVPKVTIDAKDLSVDEILDMVVVAGGYSYEIEGNIVTIFQDRTKKTTRILSGVVTDNTKETLPGVSVFIKGTQINTVTDIDGQYQLTIPSEACTVTFSYVGVKEQNIAIKKGNDDIQRNIVLELNTELSEVVVTGIFKKAKESYTGSVSTIDKEDLKVHKGQNLLQTLRNADISINIPINNLMGSNPNYIPELSIRGNSSMPTDLKEFNEKQKYTNNNPLIIMDGFEITLTKLMDFNEDEIESINVLKDASATAIYGSRGANGVIVVISKTPQPGKISISADLGLSIEVPDLSSYDLLNAREKLELEKSAGLYLSNSSSISEEYRELEKNYYAKLRKILSGVDTNWLKLPTRTGIGQTYKLRLDGGTEEFRWGTSVSYKDVQGAMKESFRRNFNGSVTLMYKLKNLTFRNYLTIGVNKGQESPYGSFSTYASQQPYNTPYDENGEVLQYLDAFQLKGRPTINPLYDATLGSFNKSNYTEITNNFSIEWEIIKNLTLRGQFGISSTRDERDVYWASESSEFNKEEYESDEGFLRRGSYDYTTGKYDKYNLAATLSYNKVFADKHNLYAGVNWEIEDGKSREYIFASEGYASDQISFLPNALQYKKDGKPDGSLAKDRRLGVTGNMNYTFDERYNLDLSFRVDGSSSFGSDKKYAPFWSVGLGWSIHNEKFMQNVEFINYLRLKMSIGETGKMHGGQSGASTLYRYLTDNKYMAWIGAYPIGLGNSRLTWEKTNEMNIGTEMQLFNNRLRLEFDMYKKNTSNLLSSIEMPLATGFSSYAANVGEVENRGFEIAANVFLLRSSKPKGFTWNISGQFAYNISEITKISEAIKAQNEIYLRPDDNGFRNETAYLFTEGRPQDALYTVQSLGVDPSTGEELFLDKDGNLTNNWKKGQFMYQGGTTPKYRGNVSNMLKWNGFTFNITLAYHGGGKMYNSTLVEKVGVSLFELEAGNVDKRVLTERWSKPGDISTFPKISYERTRASSRFIQDDKALSIQSLSLEYKWDSQWLSKTTGLQSVTFGVNMSDIYTFSSVKTERGIEYPYSRNILTNIKLYF